jgi:hypothetical protein
MGRIWKAIAWFIPRPFDSAMRAVVGGELVLAALVAIYHNFKVPAGIGTVRGLMNVEAAAARAHDVTAVSRICAPDSVVTDAGCQIPGASQTRNEFAEIYARYRAMPRFLWIQRLYAQVSWDPDNSRVAAADVTAEIVAVLSPGPAEGNPSPSWATSCGLLPSSTGIGCHLVYVQPVPSR